MPTKTKRTLKADSTVDRLAEIAKAIAAGASPESFKKEMDTLLGTEMPARDHAKEAKWEEAYRATKQVEELDA